MPTTSRQTNKGARQPDLERPLFLDEAQTTLRAISTTAATATSCSSYSPAARCQMNPETINGINGIFIKKYASLSAPLTTPPVPARRLFPLA
ncbi:hypothetical protein LPJ64_000550 [Coemansia asiatica]|uniref:Uncharacterized protein n=1 Tax=Coemansia asiatica TaxID=1052880 RepID=A0A9W7XQ37_9FUNG|nr:hypothetical protein LPJ64_000550 [Coemansia asiatica]